MPKSFPENWALRRQPKTVDRGAAWAILAGMLLLGSCCLRADGEMRQDGEYVITIFRTGGTFTPPAGVVEVEVLVVAGGGGGGGSPDNNVGSGGGGGGGVRYEAAWPVAGPVTVIVGNGGAGGVGTSRGTQGGSSAFGSLTAIGGGGGGATSGQIAGGSGGSGGGGGGANPASAGGSGTQGNAGGTGYKSGGGFGGGGGGHNTPGGNAGTTAGNGGNGSTFTNFGAYGDGGFFAGGGGGGRGGLGGTGGGGDGGPGNATTGMPGEANTGGGGGGSAKTSGAPGGSGIVLVRYRAITSVWVTGDVMLTFGDNMPQPGDWQDNVINATSQIHWNSIVNPGAYHKITVRLSDGTLPAGLQLKVYCTRAAGELVLNNTVQNFITGIGNEAASLPLRYTLVVTDAAALFAQVEPLIIEYTIESQ